MLTERIKRLLLAIAVIGNCYFIYTRLAHYPLSPILFYINIIVTIVIAAVCIYEVYKSTVIQTTEKIFWSMGFAFVGIIVIIIYFIRARQRIHKI
jgi:hypothetical protein